METEPAPAYTLTAATQPAAESVSELKDEREQKAEELVRNPIRVFEKTLDMTQSAFDVALYGLGFDGGATAEMWRVYNTDGNITVRLKKA